MNQFHIFSLLAIEYSNWRISLDRVEANLFVFAHSLAELSMLVFTALRIWKYDIQLCLQARKEFSYRKLIKKSSILCVPSIPLEVNYY